MGVLDVLVNNAGVSAYDDLTNPDVVEQHLAINLFGPLRLTNAFVPLLKRSKGAIINNLSLAALAALPMIPAYSISKAAAFNMTQSLRALLAAEGVSVHAVVLGPIDTEMSRGLDMPKASPESSNGCDCLMINRRLLLGIAGAALARVLLPRAQAANTVVFQHDQPDVNLQGWSVTAVEVNYAPGGSSTARIAIPHHDRLRAGGRDPLQSRGRPRADLFRPARCF